MSVTVVVPTVDRVELLRRCLRGLAGADVLVVHDGNPGVETLLDELGVRGLRIAARGVSAKRNAGWRAATSERVAFTDDDCEPAPGWLAALSAAPEDFVAGPVRPHPEDSAGGLWARTVTAEQPGFYPGCNLLVRRSALEAVDGFDDRMRGGEDTDLAWRVRESGASHAWVPQALVWHAVRAVTFPEHLRSLTRWAALPLLARKHPQLRGDLAHRRVFWKDSHPAAALALAGLALSLVDRRALVGILPVVVRRIGHAGPSVGVQLALNDVVETAVLAVGSVRHRSLLL